MADHMRGAPDIPEGRKGGRVGHAGGLGEIRGGHGRFQRFGIARHADWHNAKHGKTSVKRFAKLHIMQTLHGEICAAAVTPGKANDSPYPGAMIAMMPRGPGHALACAQYGGLENCQAVQDGGRRPVFEPKSGYEINGFNARAETLGFLGKRPGAFRKPLRRRNNVEGVFSSMEEGSGGVARAARTNAQAAGLPSTCTCHNVAFA